MKGLQQSTSIFLLSAGRIWREEFNKNVDRKYRNNMLIFIVNRATKTLNFP